MFVAFYEVLPSRSDCAKIQRAYHFLRKLPMLFHICSWSLYPAFLVYTTPLDVHMLNAAA